jgi:type I restriction enzyme S subunit
MTFSLTHSAQITEQMTWKLKDISLKIGSGSTPRGGEAAYLSQKVNYAFVRSQNVFDFKFNSSGVRFISDEAAQKLKGVHLQKDDILLNITGDGITFARCCIVDEEILPAAVNQHVAIIRLDQQVCLPGYLLAYLCLPETKTYIASFNAGGSRRAITKGHIESFEIPAVSIEKQKIIQDALFSLINKIDLNQKLNQTLEKMAQAIFKSWFVDFDPVTAQMRGQQPEGMDAATASLFPDKLVESELDLIPEGWKVEIAQDLFEVRDGTHDSPKKAEKGHYLVTSKHITKGKVDTTSAYLISDADFKKVNQRSKVDTKDILLTMIGTVGEVVVVYDKPVEFAIKNVGLFKTSQRPELVWLFFMHLQSFKMKNFLEVRMAGTTQQYLTLKTLRAIPVIVPSNKILNRFNEIIAPLMKQISSNDEQNKELSSLRDSLLPKLLSGEIALGKE